MNTGSPMRKRNAAATRQAILDAARRSFAAKSYEHAGLRDIACEAGVDVALIGRYFGNKEKLFREVLRPDEHEEQMLLGKVPQDELPAYFASLVMDMEHETSNAQVDRLLIILRSASSPHTRTIVSEAIEETIIQPIAGRLDGEDARLRAGMALSILMGSGILRKVMGHKAISEVQDEAIQKGLTDILEKALWPN
ncbi:TetR/AcrR family transcriptional regulator [Altericroceibacterium endophyticum]|uniref:TetR family transcriptional regulator n=1 Tax=Altericroceibacterium endophyticum TaxID=1808508 RepID=A0A6I4T0N0_9SPHN|nr:TetR/AcrR family transcriptional regulator [Altericroceibacterium endophyticum]MXO64497.1 TetR family transcriptional regulator [Altericroceibacterium endophyticum]